ARRERDELVIALLDGAPQRLQIALGPVRAPVAPIGDVSDLASSAMVELEQASFELSDGGVVGGHVVSAGPGAGAPRRAGRQDYVCRRSVAVATVVASNRK